MSGAYVVALCLVLPGHHGWLILEMPVRIRHVLFALAYAEYWQLVLQSFGLYRSYRLAPIAREWRDLGLAVLVGAAPVTLFAGAVHFGGAPPTFFVCFCLLAFVGLATERRLFRIVARRLRQRGHDLRNVVVVGHGDGALRMAGRLAHRADLGYRVVDVVEVDQPDQPEGFAHVLPRIAALIARHAIDEVFLSVPLDSGQPLLRAVVALCEEQGIVLRVVSGLADLLHARAEVDHVDGQPVITIFTGPPDSVLLVAKRAIDLGVATVALVLSAPILLVTAIAVRLDSRGPAVFAQERVGLSGRRFKFYKFRTMVVDAEARQEGLESLNEAQGPVFKIRNDPRITRVGRIIRRLSIDELPQLLNVLTGDMSIVGPRPLPVRDVERIDVPAHKRRFAIKPGITCLWQVSNRTPAFDDWIKTDMEYIDNWSLGLDFQIMIKTIPAVLSGRGAY